MQNAPKTSSSGAISGKRPAPVVTTSRLQQCTTPLSALPSFHPPCASSRLKCSGLAGLMTQLRSDNCSNASPASTWQQRPPAALIFFASASAGPTTVCEQHPHPLDVGFCSPARRQRGRPFSNDVVKNVVSLSGRGEGPGFGPSKTHALDQCCRFALCRLEPHLVN